MARKKNQDESQVDQLRRCHKRWEDLFWGILTALARRDEMLVLGINLNLERCGLVIRNQYDPALFSLVPTDEILKRTALFRKTAKILSLRGRTRHRVDAVSAIDTYGFIYGAIKDLPRRGFSAYKGLRHRHGNNFQGRYWDLKSRVENLWQGADFRFDNLSMARNGQLVRWARLSNKQIALNVTAVAHGVTPSTLKRILTEAKRVLSPESIRTARMGMTYETVSK